MQSKYDRSITLQKANSSTYSRSGIPKVGEKVPPIWAVGFIQILEVIKYELSFGSPIGPYPSHTRLSSELRT